MKINPLEMAGCDGFANRDGSEGRVCKSPWQSVTLLQKQVAANAGFAREGGRLCRFCKALRLLPFANLSQPAMESPKTDER